MSRVPPPFGEVVVCHRAWQFAGKTRRETVQAERRSRKPWTIHDDAGRDAWWHGVGDTEGSSWSDSTVESWEPLPGARVFTQSSRVPIWTNRELALRCAVAGLLARARVWRKLGDLRRAEISLRAAARVEGGALAESGRAGQ